MLSVSYFGRRGGLRLDTRREGTVTRAIDFATDSTLFVVGRKVECNYGIGDDAEAVQIEGLTLANIAAIRDYCQQVIDRHAGVEPTE